MDNKPPVTVQNKSEVGFEHQLQHLFKVDNFRKLNILHKQLPALQPGGSDLGHTVSMQHIATSTEGMRVAFMNNTNQCHINTKARNRLTTFGEKYPHLLDCVLKLNDVDNEEDLPIIWHQMANWKRDSEPLFTLLQTQVTSDAAYYGVLPMCVSVSHELSLKNFKLGDDKNTSKIDTGILTFTVTPPGATSVEATTRQE